MKIAREVASAELPAFDRLLCEQVFDIIARRISGKLVIAEYYVAQKSRNNVFAFVLHFVNCRKLARLGRVNAEQPDV